MKKENMQELYVLQAWLDEPTASHIEKTKSLILAVEENKTVTGEVEELKRQYSGQFGKTLAYFKKQLEAVPLPLKSRIAAKQFSVVAAISTVLAFTGLSIFFSQGWRLEVNRRLAVGEATIAPVLRSLEDIGKYLADGLVLVLVKTLYDLPKILLLVIFGYAYIELLLDIAKWWYNELFNDSSGITFWQYLRSETAPNYSINLLVQVLLWIAYSIIVTPAFKIITFKYALGKISFAGFFNLMEISKALRTYYLFPRSTLQAYLWSQAVGLGSRFLGLTIFIIFPFLTVFLLPAYFLLFTHWPKAYGYGTLARRLKVNGRLE